MMASCKEKIFAKYSQANLIIPISLFIIILFNNFWIIPLYLYLIKHARFCSSPKPIM